MILQKEAVNSRQNKCLEQMSINMSLSDKMADSKDGLKMAGKE